MHFLSTIDINISVLTVTMKITQEQAMVEAAISTSIVASNSSS
ncbi:hypothetical protein RV12_GL000795 [Enterococcus quebecensis]|nr:hypothetical protein RV12_GL000795 [Enterococcus quebecensis]